MWPGRDHDVAMKAAPIQIQHQQDHDAVKDQPRHVEEAERAESRFNMHKHIWF